MRLEHKLPSELALDYGRARTFVRWAMCLASAKGSKLDAAAAFKSRFPRSDAIDLIERAAAEAGQTTGWGEAVSVLRPYGDAFIEVTRPSSAVAQMAAFRAVPFNVKIPRQTSASTPTWAGEAAAGHFSALAFDSLELSHSKVVGLVAVSTELARSSDPRIEDLIGRDLGLAIGEYVDGQFLDPSKAGDDISPAAITYGAPTVAASGATAAALRADAQNLIEEMRQDGATFRAPVWVMSHGAALSLSFLADNDGLVEDGKLGGVPILTTGASIADGNSPDDGRLFLIDASEVIFADDGVELDASRAATVTMDTAPDSPTTASTTQISLFQHGLYGLKASRYVRWAPRSSPGAAAGVITGAGYR